MPALQMPVDAGLEIEALSPGDRLLARTERGVYDMTVIAPKKRQVLLSVDGFTRGTVSAFLDGCSRDGVLVHLGRIAVGCSLELRTHAGALITAPVRSIGLVKRADPSCP